MFVPSRVDVIPRFQRELTDLLCCDGDAIEFECQLTGEPEPDIKWFRYGEVSVEKTIKFPFYTYASLFMELDTKVLLSMCGGDQGVC